MSKVLVYDRGGLYVHIALALSRGFDDTAYFSEWRNGGFPTSKPDLIGRGFDKIRRVSNFFEELDGADLIVFPDVGDPGLQDHLRAQGYNVFGTGALELLEMDKIVFSKWLEEAKLPTPKTEVVTGLDDLEAILKNSEELYVKGNYRGDFETFHHIRWDLSEQWFRNLQSNIGPFGKDIEVVVQDGVDGVEIGYDGFICDGNYPNIAQWGVECKNEGYIGKVDLYEKIPEPLKVVNRAISKYCKQYDLPVRGAFSTEVRVGKDHVPYFIDPTTRFALPPSCAMSELYDNWPEFVSAIATGTAMSPKPKKKYLAEICLTVEGPEFFRAAKWPEAMNRRVKLLWWYREDGVNYSIPIDKLPYGSVGSAFGFGDRPEDAITNAEEAAASVEGYGVGYGKGVPDQLREAVGDCKKIGLAF